MGDGFKIIYGYKLEKKIKSQKCPRVSSGFHRAHGKQWVSQRNMPQLLLNAEHVVSTALI